MSSDSNEIVVMRAMQWEKVKGELRSLAVAFYSGEEYLRIGKVVEAFIENVEDEGILE